MAGADPGSTLRPAEGRACPDSPAAILDSTDTEFAASMTAVNGSREFRNTDDHSYLQTLYDSGIIVHRFAHNRLPQPLPVKFILQTVLAGGDDFRSVVRPERLEETTSPVSVVVVAVLVAPGRVYGS